VIRLGPFVLPAAPLAPPSPLRQRSPLPAAPALALPAAPALALPAAPALALPAAPALPLSDPPGCEPEADLEPQALTEKASPMPMIDRYALFIVRIPVDCARAP